MKKKTENFSIPVKYNANNKFCVATVHYSADPEKDEKWEKEAKKGMSDDQWEREYEISYELFSGKPVYPQFTQDHIQTFDWVYRGNSYVFRGWDFGFHRPACLLGFFNKYDQLCFRHEIMGHDEVIKEFAKRVIMFSKAEFAGAKFIDFGDPAGNQANSQTKESDVEVLRGLGIELVSKKSSINEGLEILRQRMLRRNDGKLGLLVHPDCKIFIDGLKGGYRYPEVKRGKAEKEKPLKDGYYDHCNTAETLILTDRGLKQIIKVRSGDKVKTRNGFKKVEKSWMTRKKADVNLYYFDNRTYLIATPEHPVYVEDKGFIPISKVGINDKIVLCETSIEAVQNHSRLLLMVLDLIAILNQKIDHLECIISVQKKINKQIRDCACMNIYGRKIIALFLRGMLSTTEMVILGIINLKIWLLLKKANISRNTGMNGNKIQLLWKKIKRTWIKLEKLLKNGIKAKQAESGILNMVKGSGKINHFIKRTVSFVVKNMKRIFLKKPNIVQDFVKTDITEHKKRIKRIYKSPTFKKDVYNLKVSGIPEYYANGILVHNCQDCARYIAINNLEVANTTGSTRHTSRENKIMRASKTSINDYF